MRENVERCGATPVTVPDEWGTPVTLEKVEQALAGNPGVKAVAFVHAETSTGVRSDAVELCRLAAAHGALSIVDTVTSLGGIPVLVDEWEADAVYSGTQKCLSCTPGLSPVTFSPRAVAAIQARTHKVQSWFLDLSLVMGYWGEGARAYHHTAPINALYGLHEALLMLREEGLHNAWQRHERHHRALVAGLKGMGLERIVAPDARLPQLNTVSVPGGVDETAVRGQLLAEYGLEIGAGLGSLAGKVWRIGLMGQSCTRRHVLLCLSALEGVLARMQAPVRRGVAVEAAQAVLDDS